MKWWLIDHFHRSFIWSYVTKLHRFNCGPFGLFYMSVVKMVRIYAFIFLPLFVWQCNAFLPLIGKRYCLMLYEEEGDEILSTIAANSNASKEVRQFCVSIMELLKMEGLIRNEKITLIPSVDEPNSKMFENDIHL